MNNKISTNFSCYIFSSTIPYVRPVRNMSQGASMESLYAGYQSPQQQQQHKVMNTSLNHTILMQG